MKQCNVKLCYAETADADAEGEKIGKDWQRGNIFLYSFSKNSVGTGRVHKFADVPYQGSV